MLRLQVEEVVGGDIEPPDDLERTPELRRKEVPEYMQMPSLILSGKLTVRRRSSPPVIETST